MQFFGRSPRTFQFSQSQEIVEKKLTETKLGSAGQVATCASFLLKKSACERRLSLFRYLFVRVGGGKSDPGARRFLQPWNFFSTCRNYSKIISLGRAVTVTFALYKIFSLLDSQIISQTTKN